jgi:hypothetical protein
MSKDQVSECFVSLRLTGCGKKVDLGVQEILRRNKFRRGDWKLIEEDCGSDSDASVEDTVTSITPAAATTKGKRKGRKSVGLRMSTSSLNSSSVGALSSRV